MFLVRGYLSSAYTLDQWDIASDVRILIVQKMRANNIQFAVPIMQVDKTDIDHLSTKI
jgi:hypothetical protein